MDILTSLQSRRRVHLSRFMLAIAVSLGVGLCAAGRLPAKPLSSAQDPGSEGGRRVSPAKRGLLPIPASTDLSIGVTPTPNPGAVGAILNFIIIVANQGPNDAPSIQMSTSTPFSTTFQSLSAPAGWTCSVPPVGNAGAVSCTNSTLLNGATATFTFAVNVSCALPNGASIIHLASINFGGSDPNPANNSATTTVNLTNPASIIPTGQSFAAAGGTGTISVLYPGSCYWTATSNAPFVTIRSGMIGFGSATVGYEVASNTATNGRSGTLTVAGMTFNIDQSAGSLNTTQTNLALGTGGAATTSTAGNSATVQAGYATVSLSASKKGKTDPLAVSSSNFSGTAVFSVIQNGVVVSEAGVPASPPLFASRFFVDYRTGVSAKGDHAETGTVNVNTGFAIVNRGTFPAALTFQLTDNLGGVLSTGEGTLPINAHRAVYIDQLNQLAANFRLPFGFGTTIQSATLEIRSNQPVSIMPLRLTTNQRGDTLLTSMPIVDLSALLTSASLYFPQLADGAGFQTSFFLTNTSTAAQSGALKIFNNTGAPMAVHRVGDPAGVTAASFNYYIPPGGLYVFRTDGSPTTVNAGSVQVIPDLLTSTPWGGGVLSYTVNGVLVTESGIPSAVPTTHARVFIDTSNGHNTGLAIAALNITPLHITLNAFRTDGHSPFGSATLDLSGNGHDARFAGQYISSLPPDFTGILDIASPLPFVALTLRSLSNARGDFLLTTFPIADAITITPTPLVFPQIVDGGGYHTQFILLNTGAAANTTLSYFGDDGTPLPLGKREGGP